MLSYFCNSKATFMKTAIKTKFINQFFKNFFSTVIDLCTIKYSISCRLKTSAVVLYGQKSE